MLSEGPLVSFNGSPTVSPITAALCTSVCLPCTFPFSSLYLLFSTYFLALSQAPPVFEAEIASYTPLTKAPGNNPATAFGPKNNPIIIGVKITNAPGATISLREA